MITVNFTTEIEVLWVMINIFVRTKKYGVFLSKLAIYARNLIRDLNPKNDLTFLRVQCKKYEMMIAPDKEYFLIVITNLE